MRPTLNEGLLRFAVAAFGRQFHLADLVGALDWHVDVPQARLVFGDRHSWAVQFLGTESHSSGSWLKPRPTPRGCPGTPCSAP